MRLTKTGWRASKKQWVIVGAVLAAALLVVAFYVFATTVYFNNNGIIDKRTESALDMRLELVAGGLAGPVGVTSAGDGTGRLFVVEQAGTIRIVQNGTLLPEPFLDISDQVIQESWEQGLFSIAFHPDFAQNGRFFIDYTAKDDGRVVVAEYRVSPEDPNRASPQATVILEVPQPSQEHHGGQLQFGPDGYLYISLGDGYLSSTNNPNSSQDLSSLLGSILRIDVDGGKPYAIPPDNPFVDTPGARGEIWAYGFRNPWRFSFDPATGRLFTGDVGQAVIEEIDLVEKGKNYGWYYFEGSDCLKRTIRGRVGCFLYTFGQEFVPPIVEYGHLKFDPEGGEAVMGGYVYRGQDFPEMTGYYFFGDFLSGRIWSLSEEPGGGWKFEHVLDTDMMISSFGRDAAGELYLTDWQGGALYRLELAGE